MCDIVKTVQSLPNFLPLKPATSSEITDAEIRLRISFADEYRKYLSAFGAIMADGIELTGIAKSEHRSVVFMTKQEWELNNSVPSSMYVVENTGVEGIIIWQNTSGAIYQSSPNSEPKEIATSLSAYLAELKG